MKILNILHTPYFAGSEQAFVNYTRIIKKIGHEIICLVPTEAKALQHLDISDIKTIINNRLHKNFGVFDILLKRFLRRQISITKPDLIVVHNGRMTTVIKSLKSTAPLLSVNHGTNPKKTMLADYAWLVNSSMRNFMINHGYSEAKATIIPNWLTDMPSISKNHKTDEVVIGAMGRLSEEKGFIYLVDAIRAIRHKNPTIKIKLLLAGDGVERANLEQQITTLHLGDIVHLLGWLDEEGKTDFFDRIDIFCLPSLYESFGIAMIEAMAHGIAVVATDCDGPHDIIEQGRNGLLVNKQGLADGLMELIANKDMRARLGQEARNKVAACYVEESVIKIIKQSLQNIEAVK